MKDMASLKTAPLPSSAPQIRTWSAVIVLLVLAAICGETIATNNTPVIGYIQKPIAFIEALLFYGTAVLLIRELARRRSLSATGFVLLGAAFGFINEGTEAGTWYTAHLNGYTFLYGVNWGWAIGLTIFHIVYSCAIPIALAEATYPRMRALPWLNRTGLIIVVVLFLLVSLTYLGQKTFLVQRTIVFIVALLMGIGALFFRHRSAARGGLQPQGFVPLQTNFPPPYQAPASFGHVPKPQTAFWMGMAGTILFYFIALFLIPGLLQYFLPQMIAMRQIFISLLLLVVCTSGLLVVNNWLRNPGWSIRSALFLAIGALIPVMLFTALLGRSTGAPFVELLFLIYLIWLVRRTRLKVEPHYF